MLLACCAPTVRPLVGSTSWTMPYTLRGRNSTSPKLWPSPRIAACMEKNSIVALAHRIAAQRSA